jgi:hypothetical protein
MAGKRKPKYPMDPLFDELKKDYCYVCYHWIKNNEGVYIGQNKWRHKQCKPGSPQWLKSSFSKDDTILSMFKA